MPPSTPDAARAPRPRPFTVFAAAIVAGTAVAVGVNVVLDAHLAQARPQVESEVILVAMRGLPAGSPVTVWDVALRDWPKAMVPTAALRVSDDLDDLVVRHPLREGQPVLATQVARVSSGDDGEAERPTWSIVSSTAAERAAPEQDLWDPGPPSRPTAAPRQAPPAPATTPVAKVAATPPRSLEVQPVVVPSREVAAPAAPPLAVPPVAVAQPVALGPVAVPTPEPILATVPPAATVTAPVAIADVAAPPVPAAVPDAPVTPPTRIDVAPEPAPSTTAARRAAPTVRGSRPHPSAVQFLAVPDPESFLADDDPAALTRRRTSVAARGGRDVSVVERGAEDAPGPEGTPPVAGAGAAKGAPRAAQATAQRPPRPTPPAARAPQRASRGAAARGYRAY
ncbi:MAG: SAF domain-containing protein [Planctomycetaceae bacterium]